MKKRYNRDGRYSDGQPRTLKQAGFRVLLALTVDPTVYILGSIAFRLERPLPVSEIGDRLREAREEQGFSLAEAEAATHIRRVFLQALEEDQFDRLPGPVYARGLLRNYATFLGLDIDTLLPEADLPAKVSLREEPRVLNEPLLRRHRLSGWGWTGIILLILAIALGVWYLYSSSVTRNQKSPLEWLPQRFRATTATQAPTATQEAARIEAPTTTPPLEEEPAASPQDSLPTSTPTATPTASPTATPTREESGEDTLELVLQTSGVTYISVEVDDEAVYEDMADAGEQLTWMAEERITLRIGDAAAAQIWVNGQDMGSLGDPEEVVDLEFTLEDIATDE